MTISVDLKLREVAWLAKMYNTHSVISPFSYIKGGRVDDEDRASLLNRGVITSLGAVSGQFAPLFDVVSSADSFTSIELGSGSVNIKAAILRRDTMSVAMTAHDDMLRWTMPANTEAIAAVFEDYIGATSLKNVDFALELSHVGATLFALLCDIYRKQVLASMASDEFFHQSGQTEDAICLAAQDTSSRLQSLRVQVEKLCPERQIIDRRAVKDALQELHTKGVITLVEDKWYLTGAASILAGSMLAWENLLSIKFGGIDGGDAYATEAVAVQAGVHDVLYIEQRPQGLWFTTLSSSALLRVLRDVL